MQKVEQLIKDTEEKIEEIDLLDELLIHAVDQVADDFEELQDRLRRKQQAKELSRR